MSKKILIILIASFILVSCKKQHKQLTCDQVSTNETINNAIFSFEKDAGKYLNSNKERSNIFFLRFLLRYSNGNLDFSEMVTENTIASLKELKQIDGLYNEHDNKIAFNYDSNFYTCLFEKFPDQVKTIFNQLDDSNYLNAEFTAKALHNQDRSIVENEAIKAYIILAVYYPTVVNNSVKKPINLK